MGFLSERYVACPQCGETINKFHRIQKCSVTGDLCCTRCIISGRFSPEISKKVPNEYREKFRFFNIIPLVFICYLIYGLLATAWPSFIGWDTRGDLFNIVTDLGRTVLIWLGVFIILYPISLKIPHLGTWMWYWWMRDPNNREKVEKAIKENEEGTYESSDGLYLKKMQLISYIQETLIKKNILFYFGILLNLTMLVFFFILKSDDSHAGTVFSANIGWVLVAQLIINLIVVWIAAGYYSNKSPENQKNRLIIEGLSWSYVILIPLSTVPYALSIVALMDLSNEIPPSLYEPLDMLYKICFVISVVVMVCLNYVLSRKTPDFNWKKNNLYEEKSLIMKSPLLREIKRIFKIALIIFLLIALVLIFVLAHELLMVDFVMVFCVVSYYFAGVYFVVIFALLKLIPRRQKDYFKYRNRYWTLVKIGALIIIINMLPTFMTVTQTNPNLEQQFKNEFGSNWENLITAEQYKYLPEVPYSIFDQYFGYHVPINAEIDNVYMEDSPRFVRNSTTGEMIGDGSSKYTDIKHKMLFNAHLPAIGDLRVEFGNLETSDVKYPVIIYVHGIGMDRGEGNANWTSQHIANLGYAVFDMSYGFTGISNHDYVSGKERGYDYPDTIQQIGVFTQYLEDNADYFHADMNNVYFAGRSFGGWMAQNLAWLYNTTWVGGNFSQNMNVRGAIPYYPATDIPGVGSFAMNVAVEFDMLDAPYIRGSSNPEDPDFNPEWLWYNSLWHAENADAGTLAPTFAIQGTHDFLVPQGAVKRLEQYCKTNGHSIISAYYPFGSHGFDAMHFSHYGQSILYYLLRFMALTRA